MIRTMRRGFVKRSSVLGCAASLSSRCPNRICKLHRIRERQIKAWTALLNQIPPVGGIWDCDSQRASQVRHKVPHILADAENGLTATAREWLQALAEELQALDQRIAATDQHIERLFAADEVCQRLAQLAGIGGRV